ncbi:MAG: hypothetical protein FJ280_30120, partial [Planctomycetes bacterium]|nr:hypothetical protein [Planctomycetota bacterium]
RNATQTATALAAAVRSQETGGGRRITTALTHGDFQPANILAAGEGTWLVDWEYADRRQAGYDGLVFGLAARFPRGLAGRLADFVTHGWPAAAPGGAADWPGLTLTDRETRRLHAALFGLEELALHLEENAQPVFTRPGEGLLILLQELTAWQGQHRDG